MVVSIEIKGLKEVEKYLKSVDKNVVIKVDNAVNQAGMFVEGEVKQSIAGHKVEPKSVDTGRFLNSVKNVKTQQFATTVETNVPYAQFLEYGTSKIHPPRRHFSNTAKRNENKVKTYIENAIKQAVGKNMFT